MVQTAQGPGPRPPRWPYAIHLALGAAAGIWGASSLPLQAQIVVAGLGLSMAVTASLLLLDRGRRRPTLWLLLGVGCGALRLSTMTEPFRSDQDVHWLLPDWPGRLSMDLRACVVRGARQVDGGWQSLVEAREIRSRGSTWEPVSGRLRIRWNGSHRQVVTGDILEIGGQAARAPPRSHPFDFDRENHDRRLRVAGTIYLADDRPPLLTGRSRRPDLVFLGGIDHLRLTMEEALRTCGQPRVLSWILAVGAGTRAEFDPADWDLVVRTGIAHLLAVSGMHLAMFVLTFKRVVQWVVGLLGWPLVRRDRRFYGACSALPLAWIYTLFTGAGIATVRAALFVSLLSLTDIFRRRPSSPSAVGASCACLLLWNPFDLFSPSFQLSLTAVIGLVAAGSLTRNRHAPARVGFWRCRMGKIHDGILSGGSMSLAAWMATAPVLAYHFGQISVSCILANILVAPFLAVVLIAGSGAALMAAPLWPGVACRIADLCQVGIDLAFSLLAPMAAWAGDPAVVGRPSVAEIVAWYGMAAALAAAGYRRVLLRQAMALGCVSLVVLGVCMSIRLAPPSAMEVWFLPVGQGDATLVRLPSGHHLLVDTGGQVRGPDPGRMVVVPVLRGLGVQRLDLVVLTHGDHDHVGGLAGVVQAYPPRELWLTPAMLEDPALSRLVGDLLATGTVLRALDASGLVFRLGATSVEVFQAGGSEWSRLANDLSSNDRSLCLRISHDGRRVLLPGDIGEIAETLLVARHGQELEADLLKVPHHGSRGSSSLAFLGHVLPRFAVFSLGVHNRFGFPHPETLRRYEDLHIRSWRTDRDGLVLFRLSRRAVQVTAGNW